ncbi:MAG TPA: mannose-1-phosphate guanylyltransferase, partial [Polyangiaceae bacterium]
LNLFDDKMTENIFEVPMNATYAVILAGGSGTRFWPASRVARPKQLLALGGDTDKSLIATTLERLLPVVPRDNVYIATGEHLVQATRAELPDLAPRAFLAEPTPRNTAACIGWATHVIARRDPNALVLVIPSDQHVTDPAGFAAAVNVALGSANTGVITTIGIQPTRPETGYGYIEVGEAISDRVSRIARFVEKPDHERAKAYVESGRFLWNSGMFFYRAATMKDAIARHLPELARGLEQIDSAAAAGASVETETLRRLFPTFQKVSIDVGVLERESTLNVVRAEFGWSDLGSFASVWEHCKKDQRGNAAPTGTLFVDADNNLVFDARSEQRRSTVAVLGVREHCLVLTDDATLLMPLERAQDVRSIVDALHASERSHLS